MLRRYVIPFLLGSFLLFLTRGVAAASQVPADATYTTQPHWRLMEFVEQTMPARMGPSPLCARVMEMDQVEIERMLSQLSIDDPLTLRSVVFHHFRNRQACSSLRGPALVPAPPDVYPTRHPSSDLPPRGKDRLDEAAVLASRSEHSPRQRYRVVPPDPGLVGQSPGSVG